MLAKMLLLLAAAASGGVDAQRSSSIAPLEAAYGTDPAQRLDLTVGSSRGRRPLIVWVHGGGWMIGDKRHAASLKTSYFVAKGYAFAGINYRLVPEGTVEQQAADIASALRWLRARSARFNFDGDRIVLMGHSAGAHLAALVATDPRYLAAAGVPLDAIDGVILLDGAGYDIAAQMAQPRYPAKRMYEEAFGEDPTRQKALSPTRHAAAPNAPNWLIMPVDYREDSVAQSNGFAAELRRGGAEVQVVAVPNSSHANINRELGTPGDFATQQVDRFLAGLR